MAWTYSNPNGAFKATWSMDREVGVLGITVRAHQMSGEDPETRPFSKIISVRPDDESVSLDTLAVADDIRPTELQRDRTHSEFYTRRADLTRASLVSRSDESNRIFMDITTSDGTFHDVIMSSTGTAGLDGEDPQLLTITAAESQLRNLFADITFNYAFLPTEVLGELSDFAVAPEPVVLLWTDPYSRLPEQADVVPWTEMSLFADGVWRRGTEAQVGRGRHSRNVSAMSGMTAPSLATLLSPPSDELRTPTEFEPPDLQHILPDALGEPSLVTRVAGENEMAHSPE